MGRVLVAAAGILAAGLAAAGPLRQDPDYHRFADGRAWLGVPNAADVLSNLAFLPAGTLGLRRARRPAWVATFLSILLVAPGSAFYHWAPSDRTLAWDRLPMALAFMALVSALVEDHVDARAGARMMIPMMLLGAGGVGWWTWTGDLRPYAWTAFFPLLVVAALAVARPEPRPRLLLAGALYLAAKGAEALDGRIWDWSGGALGGHALKHLLAAAACAAFVPPAAPSPGVRT